MADRAWKVEERRVARLFGQRRKPLSGNRQAGIGSGDTMNKDGTAANVLIEVKSWKHMPLIKHLKKVREEARKEGKPWIFAIHMKGSPERFAVCDLRYLAFLFEASKYGVPEMRNAGVAMGICKGD